MIEIKDLKNYMTDDILNELFLKREDKIHKIEEKEKQKEIFINNKRSSEDLEIALSNLPDCFEEVSRMINKAVDEKVQAQNEVLGYFCEKYKSQYQNYQKRENVFYQFREYKLSSRIINIFHLRHYIFYPI